MLLPGAADTRAVGQQQSDPPMAAEGFDGHMREL